MCCVNKLFPLRRFWLPRYIFTLVWKSRVTSWSETFYLINKDYYYYLRSLPNRVTYSKTPARFLVTVFFTIQYSSALQASDLIELISNINSSFIYYDIPDGESHTTYLRMVGGYYYRPITTLFRSTRISLFIHSPFFSFRNSSPINYDQAA